MKRTKQIGHIQQNPLSLLGTMIQSNQSIRPAISTNNDISEPTPNDVLCGKEKHCLRHEGTRRFKQIVTSYQPQYQALRTKKEKMTLTREIHATLRNRSARFLKFNVETGSWEEIGEVAVRDKISHALRHLKPKRSKKYQSAVTSRKPQHHRITSDSSAMSFLSNTTNQSSAAEDDVYEDDAGGEGDEANDYDSFEPLSVFHDINREKEDENTTGAITSTLLLQDPGINQQLDFPEIPSDPLFDPLLDPSTSLNPPLVDSRIFGGGIDPREDPANLSPILSPPPSSSQNNNSTNSVTNNNITTEDGDCGDGLSELIDSWME